MPQQDPAGLHSLPTKFMKGNWLSTPQAMHGSSLVFSFPTFRAFMLVGLEFRVQGGLCRDEGPAGPGQTPVTRAIYFLNIDQTATEKFSLCHPSASCLQQPPWGQQICLGCTALPLYLGSCGLTHARDPHTNIGKDSNPEPAPYKVYLFVSIQADRFSKGIFSQAIGHEGFLLVQARLERRQPLETAQKYVILGIFPACSDERC